MKIINDPVCVDDYGSSVYSLHGAFYTAPECTVWRCYMPGVKGHFLEGPHYTREDYRASVAAFHAMDANCNTCRYLARVKYGADLEFLRGMCKSAPASHPKPISSGFLYGVCKSSPVEHPYPIRDGQIHFHPDDWMGMKCWEART